MTRFENRRSATRRLAAVLALALLPASLNACRDDDDHGGGGTIQQQMSWRGAELVYDREQAPSVLAPALAISADGRAAAAWAEAGVIWTCRFTPAQGWAAPTALSAQDAQAAKPRVALDAGGRALFVWLQKDVAAQLEDERWSVWAYYEASASTRPGPIEQSSETADSPRVGIDGAGNAVAVWTQVVEQRSRAFYSCWTASQGWSAPAQIAGSTLPPFEGPLDAYSPELSVAASGRAFAVWEQTVSDGSQVHASVFTPGSGWTTPATLDALAYGGVTPHVAADGAGRAFAVWAGSDGGLAKLAASRCDASSIWSAREFLSTGAVSVASVRVAADRLGNAVAAWQESNDGLTRVLARRYALTGGWSPVRTLGEGLWPSADIALATNADGVAVALWTADTNVMAERYEPGLGWLGSEAVDAGEGACATPAAAVDASGRALALWTQEDGVSARLWFNRYE